MLMLGSRYQTTPVRDYTTGDGRTLRYVGLRVPPPTPGVSVHVVDEGERLDQIAGRVLGDPERFWALADANAAVRPEDLLQAGRHLAVPAPGA